MWLRALEMLFERLSRPSQTQLQSSQESNSSIIPNITHIALSTIHAPIFFSAPLHIHVPTHAHHGLPSLPQMVLPALATHHVPTPADTTAQAHASALLHSLGGVEKTVRRVGTSLHAGMLGPQILRVREESLGVWERVKGVGTIGRLFRSILLGGSATMGMGEAEALMSGMFSVRNGGGWDESILDVIAGQGHGARLRDMLGPVSVGGLTSSSDELGEYWVRRFGFSAGSSFGFKRVSTSNSVCAYIGTKICPSLPSVLASYISLSPFSYISPSPSSSQQPLPDAPTPSFAVLSLSSTDTLLAPCASNLPSSRPPPNKLCNYLPHPCSKKEKKYLAHLESVGAHSARTLVRDMYTKSWAAFERLMEVVPCGGSIGYVLAVFLSDDDSQHICRLDNKLFAFWLLTGEASYPYTSGGRKGVWRFEVGTPPIITSSFSSP